MSRLQNSFVEIFFITDNTKPLILELDLSKKFQRNGNLPRKPSFMKFHEYSETLYEKDEKSNSIVLKKLLKEREKRACYIGYQMKMSDSVNY